MRFAKIGLNNKVIDLLEVSDVNTQDSNNNFDENIGKQFLLNLTGWALWVALTDARFGDKNCYEYDEDNDCFKPKKPFASWTFNFTTGDYDPPVNYPSDYYPINGNTKYIWNEDGQTWDVV